MNLSTIGSSHSKIDLGAVSDPTKLKLKDYVVLGHQDQMSEVKGGPKLITDGCSAGRDSVVGVRLFHQFFKAIPDNAELDFFEDNVNKVFEKLVQICTLGAEGHEKAEDIRKYFIHETLLFTITALFETEEDFVVKMLGDGFIITENLLSQISYIEVDWKNTPPYKAYDYLAIEGERQFKTFTFSKTLFKNVGIASDGMSAVVGNGISFGELQKFDQWMLNNPKVTGVMQTNRILNFFAKTHAAKTPDDVTIMFSRKEDA